MAGTEGIPFCVRRAAPEGFSVCFVDLFHTHHRLSDNATGLLVSIIAFECAHYTQFEAEGQENCHGNQEFMFQSFDGWYAPVL